MTDALSLRLQEIRDRFLFLYSKSAASADNENYSIGPVMLHEARAVIEICDTLCETQAQLAAAQEELAIQRRDLETLKGDRWRPIETALKHGCRIIMVLVPGEPLPKFVWWRKDKRYEVGGVWQDADRELFVYPDATLWQPLPSAPTALLSEGGK